MGPLGILLLFSAIFALVAGCFFLYQSFQYRNATERTEQLSEELKSHYEPLEKYRGLHNTEKAARLMMAKARDAQKLRFHEAEKALGKTRSLQEVARSIRNIVEGYGDRYIESIDPFLDELAEEYSFRDAGLDLKAARKFTKRIVRDKNAVVTEMTTPELEKAVTDFSIGYFNEQVEVILRRVKHDNYGVLKQKIIDVWRKINMIAEPLGKTRITRDYVDARIDELKKASVLRRLQEEDREEQREIKARIREEKQVQKELKEAEDKARREEKLIAKAISETEARLKEASATERELLQGQLREQREKFEEAMAEKERAKSMAQQTKKGVVYVISNIGSFGENIYKIGLTRRLDPQDRVDELGDASVPFRFDVHAIIKSDDSPSLESLLHNKLDTHRVNRVNKRKEFFRVRLEDIRNAVRGSGIHEVEWTMKAEAAEYRESLALLAKDRGLGPQDDLLHPSKPKRVEDELDSTLV